MYLIDKQIITNNMKEKIIAALLAFFLGEWGIHKVYRNMSDQEFDEKYNPSKVNHGRETLND